MCARTATFGALMPARFFSDLNQAFMGVPTLRYYGSNATCRKPVSSGKPNMMFMFCTA